MNKEMLYIILLRHTISEKNDVIIFILIVYNFNMFDKHISEMDKISNILRLKRIYDSCKYSHNLVKEYLR